MIPAMKNELNNASDPIVEESRRRRVLSPSSEAIRNTPTTMVATNNRTTPAATIEREKNGTEQGDSVGVGEAATAVAPINKPPNNANSRNSTTTTGHPNFANLSGSLLQGGEKNLSITMSAMTSSRAQTTSSSPVPSSFLLAQKSIGVPKHGHQAGAYEQSSSTTTTTTTTSAPSPLTSRAPAIFHQAQSHVTHNDSGTAPSVSRRPYQSHNQRRLPSSSSAPPPSLTKHEAKLPLNRIGNAAGDNQLGLFVLAFVSSLLIIVLIFAIVLDNLLSN